MLSKNESFDTTNSSKKEVDDDTPRKKLKIALELAVPAALCMVGLYVMEISNLVFVGQLDFADALAGVGVGNVLINMFLYMLLGLNGAL